MVWRGVGLFALLMGAFALVAPPHAAVNNGHQNHARAYQVERSTGQASFVPTAQEIEPSAYKRPCQGTPDDRQSDLCAQWKSADWAKIGTIVAIFGIGALLYQIYLTIQAVEDTGKATRAMERQNEIAEDTARRQLRAYVGVRKVRISKIGVGEIPVISFEAVNTGQTPAYAARHIAKGFIGKSVETMSSEKVRFTKGLLISKSDMGAGGKAQSAFEMLHMPLDAKTYESILAGETVLGVAGILWYRDIYNRRRLTVFKHMLLMHYFRDGTGDLSPCDKGNRSN